MYYEETKKIEYEETVREDWKEGEGMRGKNRKE